MNKSKIIWHDANKEIPDRDKWVLGYNTEDGTYAVVRWEFMDWVDDNFICHNVDYWAELPEFDYQEELK